jgi:acyl carrier protein
LDEDQLKTMSTLDQRLQNVFQEVFDDEDLEVTADTSAKTLANWDSFAQVKLIVGLEEEFDVKFTTDEVATLSSAGELKRSIQAKGIE